MKKMVIISVLTTAFIGTVWAMPQGSPSPEKRIERMQQKLGLDDSQAQAIRQIMESKRAEIQQIRESSVAQINAVLTPEQQQQFAELRERRQDKRKQRRHDRSE